MPYVLLVVIVTFIHRIGVTIHNVNGVLSGGHALTQLLDRLQQYALLEDVRVLLQSDP